MGLQVLFPIFFFQLWKGPCGRLRAMQTQRTRLKPGIRNYNCGALTKAGPCRQPFLSPLCQLAVSIFGPFAFWRIKEVPRCFQWINERRLLSHGKGSFSIPKGLDHPAQGWPIQRGLPWVAVLELIKPERVEYQRLAKRMHPYGVVNSLFFHPGVAPFAPSIHHLSFCIWGCLSVGWALSCQPNEDPSICSALRELTCICTGPGSCWRITASRCERGNYSTYFWPALEYIALFVIVTMHEFGHSLACKQVGGRADQIVLWPFGGVAYVAPPRRPGATLWCIAAGPLVNVVLFPILLGSWFLAQRLGWPDSAPDAYTFTLTLCYIDLMLLVFNLLPIYPLDGGQILQSLLWFVFGYARSLMIAASLGLVGVAGLILFAIHEQAWWLGFMCILVVLYCWGGLQRARALSRLAAAPRHRGWLVRPAGKRRRRGRFGGAANAAPGSTSSPPGRSVPVAGRKWRSCRVRPAGRPFRSRRSKPGCNGRIFECMGGTGDSPVPPGHWPGGRSNAAFGKSAAPRLQFVALGSGRRVADRDRRVACATQPK